MKMCRRALQHLHCVNWRQGQGVSNLHRTELQGGCSRKQETKSWITDVHVLEMKMSFHNLVGLFWILRLSLSAQQDQVQLMPPTGGADLMNLKSLKNLLVRPGGVKAYLFLNFCIIKLICSWQSHFKCYQLSSLNFPRHKTNRPSGKLFQKWIRFHSSHSQNIFI